jgi:hypothetical protein
LHSSFFSFLCSNKVKKSANLTHPNNAEVPYNKFCTRIWSYKSRGSISWSQTVVHNWEKIATLGAKHEEPTSAVLPNYPRKQEPSWFYYLQTILAKTPAAS